MAQIYLYQKKEKKKNMPPLLLLIKLPSPLLRLVKPPPTLLLVKPPPLLLFIEPPPSLPCRRRRSHSSASSSRHRPYYSFSHRRVAAVAQGERRKEVPLRPPKPLPPSVSQRRADSLPPRAAAATSAPRERVGIRGSDGIDKDRAFLRVFWLLRKEIIFLCFLKMKT